MKLLIKEKAFSWADTFTVKDEQGNDRWLVKGKPFSFGRKLHVMNVYGEEAARIEQELFRFKRRYNVIVSGRQTASVVQEITFFKPRFTVEGPGWDVQGNFWGHEFTVTEGGRTVVSISKEWFTWGDCYVLDIADGTDEMTALAVVLSIDCMAEQSSSS